MPKSKTRKPTAKEQGRMGALADDGQGHTLTRNQHGRLTLTCPKEPTGFALELTQEPVFKCECRLRWRPVARDGGGYRLIVSL